MLQLHIGAIKCRSKSGAREKQEEHKRSKRRASDGQKRGTCEANKESIHTHRSREARETYLSSCDVELRLRTSTVN
jgi:hypothetical protein